MRRDESGLYRTEILSHVYSRRPILKVQTAQHFLLRSDRYMFLRNSVDRNVVERRYPYWIDRKAVCLTLQQYMI